MKYLQNLKLARDIKTQHEGFSDWKKQRITGLFLIPILFWIVGSLAFLVGLESTIGEIKNWFAQPYNTIMMLLFFPLFFYHAYFGTKLVIEDYIPSTMFKNVAIISVVFGYSILAISGIFAVLKIALESQSTY